ncbi:MAG TPA: adenosylcobinamide-GDP ribazoletransferase [Gemmatimonadaceae bacterium]|nr:adenosylcobinamide-GDP ribazoletransferase [Gemmatimonadaceae bacterium]
MSRARLHLRACAAAFTFLTRLPTYAIGGHDTSDLALATTYFPLVGTVVGAIGGFVFAVSVLVWPVPLAVMLSVAATVLTTGAFHEDALADALDGFGGGWNRQQILAIMKDSRVGSYALVGVALVLGAKLVALTTIGTAQLDANLVADPHHGIGAFMRALVAAHVLARWSSVPLIWRYPYVRPEGDGERPSAGRPFAAGVTSAYVVAASILSLTIVALALGLRGLLVVGVALAVTGLSGWFFDRRLGGITGDALGAANQFVELAVYLALATR